MTENGSVVFWGSKGREEKMRGDFSLQHEDSEVTDIVVITSHAWVLTKLATFKLCNLKYMSKLF